MVDRDINEAESRALNFKRRVIFLDKQCMLIIEIMNPAAWIVGISSGVIR